ncbi:TIGR03503 family protein [Idiomarina seosinensis]|uniref:TIGR03503 family protein n=1 Tax=Idiomarina seosinensis TaxID=281739 RepID=UPI00384AACDB
MRLLIVCLLLFSSMGQAQQDNDNPQQAAMELLDSPMDNTLPIKGQRFRIDNNVEEITLLFFREEGSDPLIVIRPDGSKWYDTDYPVEKVSWYTDPSFDMIKIKEPQPGPWQVAGRVDEKNKAVIVSEIYFQADPLPDQVFQNEQLKVEGVLYNGDQPVDTSRFGEMVQLSVLFVSSNDPDDDNFGATPTRVAEFQDDGKGYDEKPGDGVFTGRFNLDLESGNYLPVFELSTPLYERRQEADMVMVEPQPVQVNFVLAEERGRDNLVEITVDDSLLKPQSVAINGSVQYPNGEERRFSVTQIENFPYQIPLANLDYGKHRVSLEIFATSQQDREIKLLLDDLTFISVEPISEPTAEELAQQAREQAAREAEQARQQQAAEERQAMINVIIIIAVNILLIVVAIGFVWWKRRKKATKTEETV